MSIKTIRYDSWSSFIRDYKADIFGHGVFQYGEYLFRGQRDANWKLLSSFDRRFGHFDWNKRKTIMDDLLKYFEKYVQRSIQNTSIYSLKDSEKFNLAQHYGMPTRLLDWSYSPYIAAYFAYAGVQDDVGDVAIWVLKRDHEIWNSNIGVTIEEDVLVENDRQKQQLGCFTLLNSPAGSLDEFVESCEKMGRVIDGALTKIILPRSERKCVLTELNAMNINASTIFGGYEGCALAAISEVEIQYT